MSLTSRFTDHPAQVGETYFEHQRVAFRFSRRLAGAAVKAAVHAVAPWCCRTSASECIRELNDEIVATGRGRLAEASSATPATPGVAA